MKDIMLKITGRVLDGENEVEPMEFITEGRYYSRGGITRIVYEESELSGMEGCQTFITFSGGKVKMNRKCPGRKSETQMEFEAGKRYEGLYETPYGPIGMELLTNSISMDGRKLSIDYDLSLRGLLESRNSLDIEILEN